MNNCSNSPKPIVEKLWLDDVRPAPSEDWLHVRSVDAAINVFTRSEVKFASLDHDLGYTGPLPGPCEECNGDGYWREGTAGGQIVGMEPTGQLHVCPACDGDGFIGGDLLYIAAHAEKDGIELVKWMCETGVAPTDGVRIHSWNPAGAANMGFTFHTRFPHVPCEIREYSVEMGE